MYIKSFISKTGLLQKNQAKRLMVMVALVAFVSASMATLLTSSVFAFSLKSGDELPHDRAISYTLYQGMVRCVESGMQGDILTDPNHEKATSPSQSSQANGGWFSGSKQNLIYPSESMNCSETTKAALKLWGWGDDYAKFLTDMGYVWKVDAKGGDPGYHGSPDGSKRLSGFKKSLTKKIGALPSGQHDALYNIYLHAFKQSGDGACNGKDMGLVSKLNQSQKGFLKDGKGDGKKWVEIRVGLTNGKTEQHAFTYSNATGFGKVWSPDVNVGCDQLAKDISTTSKAFADWYKAHPDAEKIGDGGGEDGEEGEASNCKIEALGWLLCPVFELIGGISDAAYKVVALMLTVPPVMTTGDSSGVYSAWKSMRNVANVAFVLAFLIIIFSQVTSIGFSNYNIKKMVPRLVMAAILVNISFWICAIAVDLSNILGSSIKSIFDGMTEGITVTNNGDFWSGDGPAFGAIVAGVIAGTLITATADIMMLLAGLVPVLITVFIAILTVFVVLTARQAIIVLLIVISPLAFVAMLLPNTEGWFTKWRQLLQIMLLMFPIIAGIFGASALAAMVVMNSTDNIAVQILGAGIAVVPLALTPIVMKTAGGMLNKIGAVVNNPNRGPLDSLKNKAKDYKDYRRKVNTPKDLEGKGLRRTVRGFAGRTGRNIKARGEKATAAAEAAEAGYMLNNKDAAETIRLRAAESGVKSAQNAEAIKQFDKDDAKSSLGLEGSKSTSLAAALRSQEKSGEDQLIKEFQTIHGPKDGEELEKALQRAIEKDDEYEAQAIENILEGMGNKGAAVMGHVIENNGDSMSSTMRTELARNMGANVMGKNEVAKNWATSTAPEIDENGNLAMENMKDKNGNVVYDENGKAKKQVKLKADEPKLNDKGEQQYNEDGSVKMKGLNKSYSDAKSQVMKSEMKLDKIKSQESNTQSQYVHSGSMSIETMQQAIQPQHSGSFEPKDLEYMKKQIEQSIKTSSGSGNFQQKPMTTPEVKVNIESAGPSPSAPTQGGGSLKVEHTYKNPPSSAPAPAPQKLTDAQIRDALRDGNKFQ